MIIISLWMIAVCIIMFVSWAWKPMPVYLQICVFMFMVLQVSREIIEAINKKK